VGAGAGPARACQKGTAGTRRAGTRLTGQRDRSDIGIWLARGVLAAGLLVLAALLVVAGFAAWVGHNLSRTTPRPDVAAYARSAAVRGADRAAAAWFDRQLALLSHEARWLRPAGQSVRDQCRAAPDSSGEWTMICSRTQAGYYAYAGGGRAGALERALAGLGWRGFTVTPQALGADYSIRTGPPKTGLRVTWVSPATPGAISQLLTDYTAAFGQHPRAGEDGVLQAMPPDPGEITGAAAPPDAHLFIVTLQVAYATSPPSS
jgi:hypothetical protein